MAPKKGSCEGVRTCALFPDRQTLSDAKRNSRDGTARSYLPWGALRKRGWLLQARCDPLVAPLTTLERPQANLRSQQRLTSALSRAQNC